MDIEQLKALVLRWFPGSPQEIIEGERTEVVALVPTLHESLAQYHGMADEYRKAGVEEATVGIKTPTGIKCVANKTIAKKLKMTSKPKVAK